MQRLFRKNSKATLESKKINFLYIDGEICKTSLHNNSCDNAYSAFISSKKLHII